MKKDINDLINKINSEKRNKAEKVNKVANDVNSELNEAIENLENVENLKKDKKNVNTESPKQQAESTQNNNKNKVNNYDDIDNRNKKEQEFKNRDRENINRRNRKEQEFRRRDEQRRQNNYFPNNTHTDDSYSSDDNTEMKNDLHKDIDNQVLKRVDQGVERRVAQEATRKATQVAASKATQTAATEATQVAAQTATAEAAQAVASKAAQTAATEVAQAAATEATAGGISALIAYIGGPVLLIVGIILIVILLLVAWQIFVLGMPDIVANKLYKMANSMWQKVDGILFGQAQAQVSKEDIIDVAQYLENMGYDLEGSGFGKVTRNEETQEITDLKGKYIPAYLAAENKTYMIANQNFNMASIFRDFVEAGKDVLTDSITPSDETNEVTIGDNTVNVPVQNETSGLIGNMSIADWGDGMIYIASEGGGNSVFQENGKSVSIYIPKEGFLNGIKTAIWGDKPAVEDLSIDRERKIMILKTSGKDSTTWYYNLDGWTGRYGKPLEFLLTLHVGSMAPDFAYEVATADEIDTKVQVRLHETKVINKVLFKIENLVYDVNEMTEEEKKVYSITDEQVEEAKSLYKEEISYTPYIAYVTKHWYRNLDFSQCYSSSETKRSETKYSGDGALASPVVGSFYIAQERTGDIMQIAEPRPKDNSKFIKSLFDKKYEIYDGSILKDGEERPKRKIEPTKFMLYAIGMLEGVHTEDAQHVLRDLKQLLQDRNFLITDEYLITENPPEDTTERVPLEESDINTDEWGQYMGESTGGSSLGKPYRINSDGSVTYLHETSTNLGFKTGDAVNSPVTGVIVSISEDTVQIKITSGNGKGKYMIISGFKVDKEWINLYNDNKSNGKETKVSKGETLGETTDGDYTITMLDENMQKTSATDYLDLTVNGVSTDLIDFLHRAEGSVSSGDKYRAYNDNRGNLTIGYGVTWANHKSKFAKYGITHMEVGTLVDKSIVDAVEAEIISGYRNNVVKEVSGLNLTNYQIDALTSRYYNCGNINGFKSAYQKYGNTMDLWKNYMSKITNGGDAGLKSRREAEWELFTTGNYNVQIYGRQLKYY